MPRGTVNGPINSVRFHHNAQLLLVAELDIRPKIFFFGLMANGIQNREYFT